MKKKFTRPSELEKNPHYGFEIKYWDESDKRSLAVCLPEKWVDKLKTMDIDKYTELGEEELKEIVKPTPIMNQLRMRLWLAYDRAQATNTKIHPLDIYGGICTGLEFTNMLLSTPLRSAYILRPPLNYVWALEEALLAGISRLREILDLPLYKLSGEVNPATGNLILKTAIYLDMRLRGAITQKIEHKIDSRQVSVNMSAEHFKQAQSEIRSVSGASELANDRQAELALMDLDKVEQELEKAKDPDPIDLQRTIDKYEQGRVEQAFERSVADAEKETY